MHDRKYDHTHDYDTRVDSVDTYDRDNSGWGWLPLLLIPLFLLLGFLGWQQWSKNHNTAMTQPNNTYVSPTNNTNGTNPQSGVGGSGADTTMSPSPSLSPSPSVSGSSNQNATNPSQGVGGSGSYDTSSTPSSAPNTGFGGSL